MHPAVFLDRDNTLIRNDGDLGDPAKVELIQGAASAVASLRGLGFRVVVVTNQGGVARGRYKEADVEAVHAKLDELIAHYANGARIDAFYFCPYHPEGNLKQYRKEHADRKPQPGMLLRAARDLSLDLPGSWTVGDQVRDVQAGAAAGTRTILLRPDAEQLMHVDPAQLAGLDPELAEAGVDPPRRVPDFFAHDLVEAVRIIAQQRKPEAPADPKLAGKFHGRKWDAAAIAELQRTGRSPLAEHDTSRSGEREAKPDPADDDPPKAKAARPFRPWGAPEPRQEETPIARAIRAKRRAAQEAEHAASHAAMPPAPDQPATDESPRDADPGDRDKPEASPAVSATPPAEPSETPAAGGNGRSAPPPDAPPAAPQPITRVESGETTKVLKQILQELRAQRGEGEGFSSLTVVAIVLQMVAGLCLAGGLWMGGDDTGLFLRWLGAGLLVQLATLAMLLFARQR